MINIDEIQIHDNFFIIYTIVENSELFKRHASSIHVTSANQDQLAPTRRLICSLFAIQSIVILEKKVNVLYIHVLAIKIFSVIK
jgi:hypothetical protein